MSPRLCTSETLPLETRSPSPPKSRKTTILFVEDEWFLREMAVGVLDSAGYRVLKARDAAEAMNLFRRYRKIVDMLLTDVVLPGRDGGVLANEMRADKTALKVVFISGYAENVVARQSCSGDKTLYLPKPFSAESLLEKIDQVLSTE